MGKLVIIGAGLAGLSAGYHAQLRHMDFEILEAGDGVGGFCRTTRIDDFFFDYGGHFLYLNDPYIQELVKELLGDNLISIHRATFVHSHGVFTDYPFQANLFGLPPDVIKECLLEFTKAYYGNEDLDSSEYATFHDWVLAKFGQGIGRHFMFPYNKKLWTVSATELTCEWIDRYVPKPSLEEVFNGAFGTQTKAYGYNTFFWYPKHGGIQALSDAWASKVDNIRLNQRVRQIDLDARVIEFENGDNASYDKLVTTVPLKTLVGMLRGAPPAVVQAGKKLKHNSVIILNLGVKGKRLIGKHWIYIPEKKYLPYRVGVFSNFSSTMAPEGTSSYYVEIGHRPGNVEIETLVAQALEDLVKLGFIDSLNDILVKQVIKLDCAYVLFDKSYSASKKLIMDYLYKHGVYSIGRYGAWEYSGMESALLQGKAVIEALQENRPKDQQGESRVLR